MNNQTYNGWPNRATWAVNLWLSNDETIQESWSGRAAELLADQMRGNPEDSIDLSLAAAANDLADEMREDIEDANPLADCGGTLYSDLLGIAIANVDWTHLARSWIEGEKDKVLAVVAAERAADEED